MDDLKAKIEARKAAIIKERETFTQQANTQLGVFQLLERELDALLGIEPPPAEPAAAAPDAVVPLPAE